MGTYAVLCVLVLALVDNDAIKHVNHSESWTTSVPVYFSISFSTVTMVAMELDQIVPAGQPLVRTRVNDRIAKRKYCKALKRQLQRYTHACL